MFRQTFIMPGNSAVITADIVNSTKLGEENERLLFSQLKKLFRPHKAEFFRGDSFQVFLEDAKDALRLALACRTLAIQLPIQGDEPLSDVRISIGIGGVEGPVKVLATARGEAFLLSGRSFDSMVKTGSRLNISIKDPLAQLALEVISDYLDSIYSGMTIKQAEVILELLQGSNQQEIADKLKRSKSTVNQHVSSGRWPEVEKLLGQYERAISM